MSGWDPGMEPPGRVLSGAYQTISVTRSAWWLGQRRNPANTVSGVPYTAGTLGAHAYGVWILPDSEVRDLIMIAGGVTQAIHEGSVYPMHLPRGTSIQIDRGAEWHDGRISLGFVSHPDAIAGIHPEVQQTRRVVWASLGVNEVVYLPHPPGGPSTSGLRRLGGAARNQDSLTGATLQTQRIRFDAAFTAVETSAAVAKPVGAGQLVEITDNDAGFGADGWRIWMGTSGGPIDGWFRSMA